MTSAPTKPKGTPGGMPRGMIWFALGAALIIGTWWLRRAGATPLARYGPLLVIFAGAYGVVVGLETMIGAIRVRRRLDAAALASLLLVGLAAAGGWATYQGRQPYWKARRALAAGNEATGKLRAIAERHAAEVERGAAGADALELWRESAAQALPLRPALGASLESARYLAATTGGGERAEAEIDVRFYSLCLEWMDLYSTIQRSLGEASMAEPPPAWAAAQDSIVERIQALARAPDPGS